MYFYTIGHSTRSTRELIELLQQSAVTRIADVRTLPRSRRNPQFNEEALGPALASCRIRYQHIAELGGLRRRSREVPDHVNGYWQHRSFHNYADYALGAEFAAGIAQLEALAGRQRCAIMCAEAVWWRCHRRIIADHLVQRGHAVYHILAAGNVRPASLTPGAEVDEAGRVVYPRHENCGAAPGGTPPPMP